MGNHARTKDEICTNNVQMMIMSMRREVMGVSRVCGGSGY